MTFAVWEQFFPFTSLFRDGTVQLGELMGILAASGNKGGTDISVCATFKLRIEVL